MLIRRCTITVLLIKVGNIHMYLRSGSCPLFLVQLGRVGFKHFAHFLECNRRIGRPRQSKNWPLINWRFAYFIGYNPRIVQLIWWLWDKSRNQHSYRVILGLSQSELCASYINRNLCAMLYSMYIGIIIDTVEVMVKFFLNTEWTANERWMGDKFMMNRQ